MDHLKNNKLLLNSALAYILLSAVFSIITLFATIWIGAIINAVAGITLVGGIFIFLWVVYCCVNALKRINVIRNLNFICAIMLLQSFAIFFPGFHYKFSGGFELIFFLVYTNLGAVDYGIFMSDFTYNFSLNGQSAPGYMISVNLITLSLYLLMKVLKRKIAINSF